MSKDKYKGIIGTVVFHTAILLILILLGFSTSLPLPGEEGVEVNLGNSDDGIGDIQPEKPIAADNKTELQIQQQTEDDGEIVTQDIEDAPSIVRSKEKVIEKKTNLTEKKKPEKEEPQINPAALYKGKSKQTGEEGNQGITGKAGDQGNPNGTPDSDNYKGQGGSGDGLSYSLAGRSPKYLPKPSSHFTENGTVVVQISVDRYGKVTHAVAIDKGSNTTDANLRRLAEEAAKKAVFNANTDAAEVQRGTITYHFVVKD
jgi:TonB family protein